MTAFASPTRKLSLTDAGRTLYDRCAVQIEALTDAADALSGDPNGRIRVAAGLLCW